jgi:hypothetical protein
MGIGQVVFFAALSIFSYGLYATFSKPAEQYVMEENGYFGKGSPKADDTTIKPFKVAVPDEELKAILQITLNIGCLDSQGESQECTSRTRTT